MKQAITVPLALGWISALVTAAPAPVRRDLTDTVLFNSPAFQDSNEPSSIVAYVQSFVHVHQPDLDHVKKFVNGTLWDDMKDVDDLPHKIATAVDRLKLFATIGVPGVHVEVAVAGCSKEFELPRTQVRNLGFISANASLGSCSFVGKKTTTANLTSPEEDDIPPATAFYSPPTGWGVISDVDDTVKVTNVLNKSLAIANTLYKDPKPVAGMPELYSRLVKSISSSFFYVSSSPIQLYPFLSGFLQKHYPDSNGPLFLHDLSITNLKLIFDSFGDKKDEAKVEYKVEQINKIRQMYPKKKFLAIGDSTEMDAEVYGKVFRENKDFIRCIWIHLVDGGKNDQVRFDAAFEGVSKEKYRLYKDAEIKSLKDVDLAGGKC